MPRPSTSHLDAVHRLCKDFRQDLGVLTVKYGQPAVDKAPYCMQDAVWPSVELH